jgi:hypothetical protein
MAKHDDSDEVRNADSSDVAMCVRTLNHTIGELARRHGAACVVVALTEVMGCASCITDTVERSSSMRALVERISVAR